MDILNLWFQKTQTQCQWLFLDLLNSIPTIYHEGWEVHLEVLLQINWKKNRVLRAKEDEMKQKQDISMYKKRAVMECAGWKFLAETSSPFLSFPFILSSPDPLFCPCRKNTSGESVEQHVCIKCRQKKHAQKSKAKFSRTKFSMKN